MTHQQARETISAGERTVEVQQHLAQCKSCRAWTQTLERIQHVAPQTFADMPSDLAGNVMAAVRAAAPVPLDVARAAHPSARTAASIRRRVGWRLATASGVAAAVAAAAILIPRSNQPPSIAVAAKTTEAARTARFELTTSFALTPAKPITLARPDIARIAASIRRNLPAGLPSPLRSALARAANNLPRPTTHAIGRIESSASGRGEVAFPGGMRFVAQVSENDGVMRQSGRTETIQIGPKTWIRTALFGDKWLLLPGFGAEIAFNFQPADFVARVGDYGGATSSLGVETRNGERVRHYRFADRRSFGRFLGTRGVVIDAWIGVQDRRLHELNEVHTGDDAQGRLVTREHVRLYDFGARVSIRAPAARDTTTIDAVAAGFYGYGFGMAGGSFQFSFTAAARMPDFSFPQIRIPEFHLPDFKLPDFTLPEFTIPTFPVPTFSPPSFPDPAPSGFDCC